MSINYNNDNDNVKRSLFPIILRNIFDLDSNDITWQRRPAKSSLIADSEKYMYNIGISFAIGSAKVFFICYNGKNFIASSVIKLQFYLE